MPSMPATQLMPDQAAFAAQARALQQLSPQLPHTLPSVGLPPTQVQTMLALGQAQYVMIPGVGLTLVPVMHMPHMQMSAPSPIQPQQVRPWPPAYLHC